MDGKSHIALNSHKCLGVSVSLKFNQYGLALPQTWLSTKSPLLCIYARTNQKDFVKGCNEA